MPPWEIDKLSLFLIFFIPGFISIKVFSLMVPTERRDFSKSVLEVIGYSCLNFAALSWLIIPIHSGEFESKHRFLYALLLFVIIFIVPVLWPVVFVKLSSWKWVAKHVLHPIPKPWDYVFGKREAFWVIVHLKDGTAVGGRFDTDSFASSYPSEEQIYLQEVWRLNQDGSFREPVARSQGIIILSTEMRAVEFFQ